MQLLSGGGQRGADGVLAQQEARIGKGTRTEFVSLVQRGGMRVTAPWSSLNTVSPSPLMSHQGATL